MIDITDAIRLNEAELAFSFILALRARRSEREQNRVRRAVALRRCPRLCFSAAGGQVAAREFGW